MLLEDEQPDDLRAVIEAAAKETPEPDAVVDAAPSEASVDPAAEAKPSSESTSAAAPSDKPDHPSDPLRYADGTFKPKTVDAPEKAAPETVSPSVDTQTKASTPAQPVDAPPAGWTAAEKAEWSKLPPAIQTAVSRREAEMTRGGQQWSEQKRQYEQILSPLAQETARLGIPVDQGLNALLAAHHKLNQNPAGAIQELARQYNVDLATLAGHQPSEAPQGQDISAIENRLMGRLAPIEQRLQQEEFRQQQQVVNSVTSFAASPGHEHFDTVQHELMAMIPQIKSMNPGWSHEKILQDAYDRAVFANPTTRQLTLAARDAKAEEVRRNDAAEHARRARTASVSVTGAPSGTPAAVVPDTIRGALEQAWSGSP